MSKCQACAQAGKYAFCSLKPEARSFLETNSVVMEYPRGTILLREGDRATAVFVICFGKVKVSAASREGRTMILRIAGTGDVLGLSAALSNRENEVTAEVLEPCKVRVLHLRHLATMLEEFGDAGLAAPKRWPGTIARRSTRRG